MPRKRYISSAALGRQVKQGNQYKFADTDQHINQRLRQGEWHSDAVQPNIRSSLLYLCHHFQPQGALACKVSPASRNSKTVHFLCVVDFSGGHISQLTQHTHWKSRMTRNMHNLTVLLIDLCKA